jgi:hypothetical protein
VHGETLSDAREQLRTYRANVSVPVRMVKRRVRLEVQA